MTSQQEPTSPEGALVYIGEGDCTHQAPQSFQLCPLGFQFYSCRPLEEFTMVDFALNIPGATDSNEPVKCTGAVVRCEQDKSNNRYRIWIKFLDLPDGAKEHIRCISQNGKHLCCFCENF